MKTDPAPKPDIRIKRDSNGPVPRAGADPYALSQELRAQLAAIPRVASVNTNALYRQIYGKKAH